MAQKDTQYTALIRARVTFSCLPTALADIGHSSATKPYINPLDQQELSG